MTEEDRLLHRGNRRLETVDSVQKILGEERPGTGHERIRDTVEGTRDGTRNGAQRVGVATQGDCIADGILVGRRLEEGRKCLRHGSLACFVESVVRANTLQGVVGGEQFRVQLPSRARICSFVQPCPANQTPRAVATAPLTPSG